MQLTAIEARVLGSLMEKEVTTPDLYPLSLNALLAACNQKSSREPVMTLTEGETRDALQSLDDLDLVSVDHGSRVSRYENRARTVFQLRRDEAAILCLLLLRGPQTPGELRSRADRLFAFDDISAALSALNRLATGSETRSEPLVAALERQPGTKEQRYAHLLTELPAGAAAGSPAPLRESRHDASLAGRVAHLESEVALLHSRLDVLTGATAPVESAAPTPERTPEESSEVG